MVTVLFEPEVAGPVRDEPIQLGEAALVQEHVETLARGQLALGVLRRETRGAAPLLRLRTPDLQKEELLPHGHRRAQTSGD